MSLNRKSECIPRPDLSGFIGILSGLQGSSIDSGKGQKNKTLFLFHVIEKPA